MKGAKPRAKTRCATAGPRDRVAESKSFPRLSNIAANSRLPCMIADVARVFLGLLVVLFHRPIAEYILAREQAVDNMIRSRGVRLLPPPPSTATAHPIYFFLGAFICVFSLPRLWVAVH